MYGPGYPPPMGAPMPGYGPQPIIREKARGYGIDPNEYTKITQCCAGVYQQGARPYSTNAANAIREMLGGHWAVVCYPENRAYDFALTTVKGGDFMTFTVNDVLFQVCRLK